MTSATKTVLAIDLGTQSLRVSALRTNGERLWTWAAPVDSLVHGDCVEQDTMQWSALLEEGLNAAARAGIKPDVIAAAGPLAGFVPMDGDAQALGPAVMYSDRRSAEDVAQMATKLNGRLPARILVSDPIPHWLRLKRETPAVATRTAWFLDATGWINFYLTGVATLNAYSAMRLYLDEFRESVGAMQAPFGRAVGIGETIGNLSPQRGDASGWTGVPVVAATFDSKCAYIGSGIDAPGDALDISGTVTSFGVVANAEMRDPQQRIYSVPLGKKWLVRGSTACAGSALEWVRGQLLPHDFSKLDASVASVPPGANGVTFLPYLAGERAPLWNPHARGAFLGLGLHTSQADITRAVYEGIALSLAHIAKTMRDGGVDIKSVRLAGGLARNALLGQIKADVLGVPVIQLVDHELTTLGLAVIASVAFGVHVSHAAASRNFVAVQRRLEPEPQAVQAYISIFERYAACSDALLPTFHG